MDPSLSWQPMTVSDAGAVKRLAGEAHAELPERVEVFAEKIRLFPTGCRKLLRDDRCVGYALSHPWQLHSVPPLDTCLGHLPADANCLHLHDIVVLPEARGLGAPGDFIARSGILAQSLGLAHLTGVSVYGTDVLWSRFGFTVDDDPTLLSQLASYGPTARYITRPAAP